MRSVMKRRETIEPVTISAIVTWYLPPVPEKCTFAAEKACKLNLAVNVHKFWMFTISVHRCGY